MYKSNVNFQNVAHNPYNCTTEIIKGSNRCEKCQTYRSFMSYIQTSERNDTKQSHVDNIQKLIYEQAGFRPGKSCTSPVLRV